MGISPLLQLLASRTQPGGNAMTRGLNTFSNILGNDQFFNNIQRSQAGDVSALFSRANEMENQAYNTEVPRMGSPVGKNDILPIILAALGAKLIGANAGDIGQGLTAFAGTRQGVAEQRYNESVNQTKMKQSGLLAGANQLRDQGALQREDLNTAYNRRAADKKLAYDKRQDAIAIEQRKRQLELQEKGQEQNDEIKRLNAELKRLADIQLNHGRIRDDWHQEIKNIQNQYGFVSDGDLARLTRLRDSHVAKSGIDPDQLPLPRTENTLKAQRYEQLKKEFSERMAETKWINREKVANWKALLGVADQRLKQAWQLGAANYNLGVYRAELARYNGIVRASNSEVDGGIQRVSQRIAGMTEQLKRMPNDPNDSENQKARQKLELEISSARAEREYLKGLKEEEIADEGQTMPPAYQGGTLGVQPGGSAPLSPFGLQPETPNTSGLSGAIGGAPGGGTRATGSSKPNKGKVAAAGAFAGAKAGASGSNPKENDRKEALQLIKEARAAGRNDVVQKVKKRFRDKYKEDIG